MINKYFFEVFENVPRQGPGSNKETRTVYNSLSELPSKPAILDVGCGAGVQTVELANNSDGHIIAMDRHMPFLIQLQQKVTKYKLHNKLSCLKGDMADMPFVEQQFNLIWAEGSVFIVGYEHALTNWRQYLKDDGYFVFSDCVWLKDNQPQELLDFWNNEGIEIPTKKEIIEKAKEESYKVLDHFTIAKSSWQREFYAPFIPVLKRLREKYEGNTEALQTFHFIEKEIVMYDKYNDYFGYKFFTLQKK